MREILGKLVQTVQHQFRRGHFVCAGGKLYPQTGGLIAVKAAQVVVFFRPHFHRGDIAQTHFRTILIHAQGDVAELVRRLQQGLRIDGGVQGLLIDGRRSPQLPHRNLGVLGLDGIRHVGCRHLDAVQLVGVEPDAH